MNNNITDSTKLIAETEAERNLKLMHSSIPQTIFETYKGVYLRLEIRPDLDPEYCLYVRDSDWNYQTYYGSTTNSCIEQCINNINATMEKRASYYREQANINLAKAEQYEAKILGSVAKS
jgi:hypothetical protein